MLWLGKFHSYLSKGLLAQRLRGRRYCSISKMNFRIYPHRFPFAMVNIMDRGRKFLKVTEEEDPYFHNRVQIESNGLIDPYVFDPDTGS